MRPAMLASALAALGALVLWRFSSAGSTAPMPQTSATSRTQAPDPRDALESRRSIALQRGVIEAADDASVAPSTPLPEDVAPGTVIELSESESTGIRRQVTDRLDSIVRSLHEYFAAPRSVETLAELLLEHQRRVDLRRAEVFLSKIRRNEIHYVRTGAGVPRGVSGKLFRVQGSFRVAGKGDVDAVQVVGPGEDPELDLIVRAANEVALAHAEALAGEFNNLDFAERERRCKRILELKRQPRSNAVATELAQLGVHEYLVLVPERFEMAVTDWVRNWTWCQHR
jgi:hypothetical protein